MESLNSNQEAEKLQLLTRSKKLLFDSALVFMMIILCELCSAMALWGLGLPAEYERIDIEAPDLIRTGYELIHPYVGYVFENEFPEDHPNYYGFANTDGQEIQKRSPEKLIVATFGGSMAYHLIPHSVDEIERALRTYPPYKDKEIVFVRLALPGFKQPQQLMALTYFLSLGAEFDVLINLDGFNEVALPAGENIPQHIFPAYPRSWAQRFSSRLELEKGAVEYLQTKRDQYKELYQSTPLHWSRTITLAWALVDKNMQEKIERRRINFMDDSPLEKPLEEFIRYQLTGPPYTPANTGALLQDLADIWSHSSQQMGMLARANGMRYFHFLQPNQYVKNSKPMNEQEQKTALGNTMYGPWIERGYSYLQEEGKKLQAKGVYFTDLSMIFKDHKEPLYVDPCCHVSRAAYDIMGDAMGKAIERALKDEDL